VNATRRVRNVKRIETYYTATTRRVRGNIRSIDECEDDLFYSFLVSRVNRGNSRSRARACVRLLSAYACEYMRVYVRVGVNSTVFFSLNIIVATHFTLVLFNLISYSRRGK